MRKIDSFQTQARSMTDIWFYECDKKNQHQIILMFTFNSPAAHRWISIHLVSVHVKEDDAAQSDKNDPFCHPKVIDSSLMTRPHSMRSARGPWRKMSCGGGSRTSYFLLCSFKISPGAFLISSISSELLSVSKTTCGEIRTPIWFEMVWTQLA